MISLVNNIISIGGKEDQIAEFRVCWLSVLGIHETREEAMEIMSNMDGNPELIRPIVVAVGKEGLSEPMYR